MPHVLKNYMEDCVVDMLDLVLQDMDICKCEQCRYDITAFALNSLQPKYVVTKRGELYTKLAALQSQFNVDIIAAITKGSVVVGKNPRHDEEDVPEFGISRE